jgi:signal transduction histidine kinase
MIENLAAHDLRVLVFAPVGRDAVLTRVLLARAGIAGDVCPTMTALTEGLEHGAGAIVLTEEALDDPHRPLLSAALGEQPAWSDIPVLLFASGDRSQALLRTLAALDDLRNVTLLDRPIRVAAVISTVRAALRARARQYELRDVLVALHAARDEAERANRLKDEFLATLSHELRTPLNAVLGWVSMLRRAPVSAERLPEILEIIERNAQAQAKLIGDVLDVSRIITGRLRLNREAVLPQELIEAAIENVRPAADAKNIEIRTHVDDMRPIHADRQRMQQVLWNILSNSVKFTPSGGRLEVRTRHLDSQVEISVTDTGVGLEPGFLPFVFDRFRQADQTFTRAHGGLGLGLAIVKHIVELHGGHVTAESEGVGQGATFRVVLPVEAIANSDSRQEAPECTLPTLDLSGRSILVVDDDASTRELLTEILSHCHAHVETADSARAALECVEHDPPALIIADIGMPGEDGLAMMGRLRRLPPEHGGTLPAIALSTYARAEDKAAALSAGFSDFLTKPATPEDVIRAVQHVLI